MTKLIEIQTTVDQKVSVPHVEYQQIKVVTTEILAQLFGCDVKNIQMNFSRNQSRFELGKHYFLVTGADLKEFKNQYLNGTGSIRLTQCIVGKNAKSLILWTKEGISLLSTILENKHVRYKTIELFNKYFDVSCNDFFILEHSRKELDYADILIRFCNSLNLNVRLQVNIKKYRVDFIVEDKIFIEYDESHHKNNYEKDKKRQENITSYWLKKFHFIPIWIRLNQGYEIESLAQIVLNLKLLK